MTREALSQLAAAQEVLAWLAERPEVHWLAPRAASAVHNWQAAAVCQSARAAPEAPVPLAQDQGTHPLWAAGLTGRGHVIGAGDSGIGARAPRRRPARSGAGAVRRRGGQPSLAPPGARPSSVRCAWRAGARERRAQAPQLCRTRAAGRPRAQGAPRRRMVRRGPQR